MAAQPVVPDEKAGAGFPAAIPVKPNGVSHICNPLRERRESKQFRQEAFHSPVLRFPVRYSTALTLRCLTCDTLRAVKEIQVRQHVEIGAGEQRVKPICVLLQSAIHCFGVSKLTLYDPEDVFHFTANRRLAMIDKPRPINCVVRNLRQASRPANDTAIDRSKVFVFLDFRTFLYGMNQSCSGIRSSMALHSEAPFSALVWQMKKICAVLYAAVLNIDCFPTNFVEQQDQLYYFDYERNDYVEEWSSER